MTATRIALYLAKVLVASSKFPASVHLNHSINWVNGKFDAVKSQSACEGTDGNQFIEVQAIKLISFRYFHSKVQNPSDSGKCSGHFRQRTSDFIVIRYKSCNKSTPKRKQSFF